MEKQHEVDTLATKEQVKLEWNTPIVDILDINDKTLSGFSGFSDGFSQS